MPCSPSAQHPEIQLGWAEWCKACPTCRHGKYFTYSQNQSLFPFALSFLIPAHILSLVWKEGVPWLTVWPLHAVNFPGPGPQTFLCGCGRGTVSPPWEPWWFVEPGAEPYWAHVWQLRALSALVQMIWRRNFGEGMSAIHTSNVASSYTPQLIRLMPRSTASSAVPVPELTTLPFTASHACLKVRIELQNGSGWKGL